MNFRILIFFVFNFYIMGNGSSSNSTIKNSITNEVVKNTSYESLSEDITNFVADQSVKIAQECSAFTTLDQIINIQDIKVVGNFNVEVDQSQDTFVDLSCLMDTKVNNSINVELIKNIVNNITSNLTNENVSKLESAAEANSESPSWTFGGSAESKNDIDNQIGNYFQDNKTYNIRTIVTNSVLMDMSTNIVQTCVSSIRSSQKFTVYKLDIGGDVNIFVSQEQATKVFKECIGESNIGGNIVQRIATGIGLEVQEKTEVKNDSSSQVESTTTSKITTPILDFFGSFLGQAVSGLLCIVCIIAIFIVIFMNTGGGKKTLEIADKNVGKQFDLANNVVNTANNSINKYGEFKNMRYSNTSPNVQFTEPLNAQLEQTDRVKLIVQDSPNINKIQKVNRVDRVDKINEFRKTYARPVGEAMSDVSTAYIESKKNKNPSKLKQNGGNFANHSFLSKIVSMFR